MEYITIIGLLERARHAAVPRRLDHSIQSRVRAAHRQRPTNRPRRRYYSSSLRTKASSVHMDQADAPLQREGVRPANNNTGGRRGRKQTWKEREMRHGGKEEVAEKKNSRPTAPRDSKCAANDSARSSELPLNVVWCRAALPSTRLSSLVTTAIGTGPHNEISGSSVEFTRFHTSKRPSPLQRKRKERREEG